MPAGRGRRAPRRSRPHARVDRLVESPERDVRPVEDAVRVRERVPRSRRAVAASAIAFSHHSIAVRGRRWYCRTVAYQPRSRARCAAASSLRLPSASGAPASGDAAPAVLGRGGAEPCLLLISRASSTASPGRAFAASRNAAPQPERPEPHARVAKCLPDRATSSDRSAGTRLTISSARSKNCAASTFAYFSSARRPARTEYRHVSGQRSARWKCSERISAASSGRLLPAAR